MLTYLLAILAILLEWFSWLSSADDFKTIITGLAGLFGASKIWDFWQKRNDNATKVKEAEINAQKEIENNKDKHNAKIKRLEDTITFQAGEIKYKDSVIIKLEENVREYKRKNEELVKVNDIKDEEIRKMHERLLDCEKSKKK